MKIIVDTREKFPWSFDNDIEVITKKLDTGDYSIQGLEGDVSIERKASVSEFYGNVTKKRFWNEMSRMSELAHKFAIFEFALDDLNVFPYGSGLPQKAIQRMKISSSYLLSCVVRMHLDYKIHVIFAGDRHSAITITTRILKKIYGKYNN